MLLDGLHPCYLPGRQALEEMQKKAPLLNFGQFSAIQQPPCGFLGFLSIAFMYQVQIKGWHGKLLCFLQPIDAHIQTACPIFMCDLLMVDFIRQGFQLQKVLCCLAGVFCKVVLQRDFYNAVCETVNNALAEFIQGIITVFILNYSYLFYISAERHTV